MISAYLAGPDVFLEHAREHAAKKVAICAKFGLQGCPPLNEDIAALSQYSAHDAWRLIYNKDIEMMEKCEIIIANLTPFGGASADAGTLIEVGWFLGRGKPIFGYSNSRMPFEGRMSTQLRREQTIPADIFSEGFGLPDNLMIVGAVQGTGYPIVMPVEGGERPFDALDVFETCVSLAAKHCATAPLSRP